MAKTYDDKKMPEYITGTPSITPEIIDAYSQCERKAFFMLRGEIKGTEHELPLILNERAKENRLRFMACDATPLIESGDLIADCDVLLKAESPSSPSKKGCDQQMPYLVVGTYSVSKQQRLRLAFAGHVSGLPTRHRPTVGFIVTSDGEKHRININPLYTAITSALNGLAKMIGEPESDPPKLFLNSHCPLCLYRDHCHHEAERTDDLSLLGNMTPKIIRKHEKKGISTIKQLSYIYNPRRRKKKSFAKHNVLNFSLQALAIRTGKIYLHKTPCISAHPVELFLDIEGIPDQDFYYLIGLIVANQGVVEKHSFWADAREGEAAIFAKFVAVAATYGDAPIYHYGSYESKALGQIVKVHGLKTNSIEKRFVNVNEFIYGKVYFPSMSNRLKDLGAVIGATWHSPEASGLQSLVWRYRWEENHDDQLKQTLLRYNQDDCCALQRLLNELRDIGDTAATRNDVEFSLNPKRISTEGGESIHTQLERIIVSAHEDRYQFNRIKINHLKESFGPDWKQERKKSIPRKVSAKGGITVRVPPKRYCLRGHRTALIASTKTAEHALIELIFTKAGCKKSIVRYVGKKADCPTCGAHHLPPSIQRFHSQVFGHQLQSWVVHQRIVLRLPFTAIVMQTCDLFNVKLRDGNIDVFVERFARIYAPTEKRLLGQILSSPAIHVDETKVNILGANQYAWVITNGRHVVFRLTETRETTFLQAVLKDYKGVLISDFYGGYDAFTCRQQKCLSHLLRDINEELWKNPFNQDYENFVGKVSGLLVPIFDDVYKYGLKKRHLGKHMKTVDLFYKQTISVPSPCELVEKYQKRFGRFRESLFTFLQGDGIPWNNNMAERGIRHLAIQRKISGRFSKAGAERYLILLGIAQSCRFQKQSFLRFLLSGELDVDKFNEKKYPPRNAKANI